MSTVGAAVREFFDGYELSRNTLDLALIASQYGDACLFADPSGTKVVEKQAVLATVPKGQEFLRALGHRQTKIVSLDETRLDDQHVVARVQFQWRFEKPEAPPIDVDLFSTFILYVGGGAPRIVFQHEREDFQQALRARGVLPAKA